MELRDRQATWNGFGEAFSLAVEIVVTPLLFALLGWWLDSLLGTGPVLAIAEWRRRQSQRVVLAIAFGLFGIVGQAIRIYYQYRARMEREEEGKPWTQSRP